MSPEGTSPEAEVGVWKHEMRVIVRTRWRGPLHCEFISHFHADDNVRPLGNLGFAEGKPESLSDSVALISNVVRAKSFLDSFWR